jgi:hypothetical protein
MHAFFLSDENFTNPSVLHNFTHLKKKSLFLEILTYQILYIQVQNILHNINCRKHLFPRQDFLFPLIGHYSVHVFVLLFLSHPSEASLSHP